MPLPPAAGSELWSGGGQQAGRGEVLPQLDHVQRFPDDEWMKFMAMLRLQRPFPEIRKGDCQLVGNLLARCGWRAGVIRNRQSETDDQERLPRLASMRLTNSCMICSYSCMSRYLSSTSDSMLGLSFTSITIARSPTCFRSTPYRLVPISLVALSAASRTALGTS